MMFTTDSCDNIFSAKHELYIVVPKGEYLWKMTVNLTRIFRFYMLNYLFCFELLLKHLDSVQSCNIEKSYYFFYMLH